MHSVRCDSSKYGLCLLSAEHLLGSFVHTSHFLSVLIFRIGTELGNGDLIIYAPRRWGSNRLTCYLPRKPSDATLRSGGARDQGWSEKKTFRFILSLSLLFVLSPLEWLLSHCGLGSLSLFRSSTAGKPCCGLFCTTQSSTRPPHPFLRPVVCAERITNARGAPLSSKAIARRFLLEFTSPAGSPLLSSHAQFYLLPSGDRFGLPSLCHGLST